MKHLYLQVADKLYLQVTAPLTGGGTGLILWAEQIAPLISIVAAVVGIILGLLTFLLKWQDRSERKYKSLYLRERAKNNPEHED